MAGHEVRVLGLVRQQSTPKQRKLTAVVVASELLFIFIGFEIGYAVSTSNRVAVSVFGAFAGGIVWVLACWILRASVWAWRRRRAGQTSAKPAR